MYQFNETRKYFFSVTNITEPLSYSEWMDLSDSDKIAALYLQFYSEITLAYSKVKTYYSDGTGAVEELLMYLVKNVPKIEEDEKKFSPRYIYRVAFNCLYCYCIEKPAPKNIADNEISENYVTNTSDDINVSLIDLNSNSWTSIDSELESQHKDELLAEFWRCMENVDMSTEIIINKYFNVPSDMIKERMKTRSDWKDYVKSWLASHPGKSESDVRLPVIKKEWVSRAPELFEDVINKYYGDAGVSFKLLELANMF